MERERNLVKLCMKHFREQSYLTALNALEADTGVQLESADVSHFYRLIVNGNFQKAEEFLDEISKRGLFDEYINSNAPKAQWNEIGSCGIENWPKKRGGHQMCIDSDLGFIYLFGGWDGFQDLADFWRFDINTNKWSLINSNTEQFNGPSARSCHKILLDSKKQIIYVLGRYLDMEYRTTDAVKSDFYKYDLKMHKWTLISKDTSTENGPKLLYDHQMCIDEDSQKIYVFGGRFLLSFKMNTFDNLDCNNNNYSGLFVYHIIENVWQELLLDLNLVRFKLQSRVSHSMVFDSYRKQLLIFFGQRGKVYFSDMVAYHTDYNRLEPLIDTHKSYGELPIIGFTQKATIDVERREIYVLAGLSKSKDKVDGDVHRNLWIYNIDKNQWKPIKNRIDGNETKDCMLLKRFAHQLVYDTRSKMHYLFGGNPGHRGFNSVRLNDFWKMIILKPTVNEILFKMKLSIRLYWYEELSKTNPYRAIRFLQNDLYDFFDHSNNREEERYRKLVMNIFKTNLKQHVFFGKRKYEEKSEDELGPVDNTTTVVDIKELFFNRSKLFDNLMKYFPTDIVQPSENLSNFFTER